MFNSCPQPIRLIQDLDGYLRVYDTADWTTVLADVRDASGDPLIVPEDATLALQIRPQNLPGCIVDSLDLSSGLTITIDPSGLTGPSIGITSFAVNRTWAAREETTLIGDLMLHSGNSTLMLKRLHFTVTPGVTRP